MKTLGIVIFVVCFVFGIGTASAGTINFENMPQNYWYYGGHQNFGNYWQGINFGPDATVLEDQIYSYNYTGYPPHSGHAVLFSYNTPSIRATFDNPVNYVSMWYSTAYTFMVKAYDVNNNLLDSEAGVYNIGTNSFIDVASQINNIKYVLIEGTGNYFTIDDFSASSISGRPSNAVPEPSTILLLGAGLVGAGIAARRFRR